MTLLTYSGKLLGQRFINSKTLENKLENFDVFVHGLENLEGRPCILASNHVRPLDGGLWKTGIAPDSFIIKKIISEKIGKEISVVVNFGLGSPFKFFEGFTKGIILGISSIPVKGGDKESFRNDFLKGVENAINKSSIILIHPVGKYYDDFEPHHELKAGAAYIALKYNLPVIPTYIKGCVHWDKKGQKVQLSFGKKMEVKGKTVDEINEEIKEGILNLKLNNMS